MNILLYIFLSFNLIASKLPLAPHHGWQPQSYEKELNQYLKTCLTEECSNNVLFLKAQLWSMHNSHKACMHYLEFNKKNLDPLYPISLLKTQYHCKLKKNQKIALIDQIQNYITEHKPAPWLEKELSFALFKLGLHERIFNVLSFTKSKREKEKILKDLLSSKEIKNKKIIANLKSTLETLSPRFGKPSLVAAQDAIATGEAELAINILNKVKVTPLEEKKKLELLRQSYKLGQNKKQALSFNKKIFQHDRVQFNAKPDASSAQQLLQSSLNFARAAWTEHNSALALQTLEQTEKLLFQKVNLSELYFIRSRIQEETLGFTNSIASLEQALKEIPGTTGLTVNIMWNLGWGFFKSKRYAEAQKYFEQILDLENLEPGRKSQVMFWLAQSAKKLNNQNQAEKYFNKIKAEDPFGYYSILSYKELHEKLPALKFNSDSTEKYPSQFNLQLFEKLIIVGELKYTQLMLDADIKPLENYFWLYKKAQYFSPLFNYWTKLSNTEKSAFLKNNGDYLYPLVFKDLVYQASEISGLWPEYIWAIMRQESSFNVFAQSSANAVGLMQLLPSVAKKIAQEMNISLVQNDDLYDPSINIKLGAKHLRNYWDDFNGKFVLATASYNASAQAVKSWLKSKPTDDVLIFIEEIPYEETRSYVKLVLRNLVNYMRINSQSESIEFPYWTLNL